MDKNQETIFPSLTLSCIPAGGTDFIKANHGETSLATWLAEHDL